MDEAGREVFDLSVTDQTSGKTSTLGLKSGGEKMWILMALRLAVTIYAKEKSGRDFRTLFCDEIDGGLDPGSRPGFVTMLRSAMKYGEFESVYLITHSQEVIDLVDHRMVFSHGGITID
jgi:DNA repair exonuclease SbcCD ATPase subunit